MFRVFLLYAASGFISLAYQVAWFRIFMDWFGSTSLTFGLVVANFIGGLGVGAYFSRSIVAWLKQRTGLVDNLRVYGSVEILVGLTALLTIIIGLLPAESVASFPYTLSDGIWELALVPKLIQLCIAIFCVLVPCILMGVTFPLLCHSFLTPDHHTSFPSSLYAWNTLGACSGVLTCQFIMLPAAGHGMTFLIMAVANIVLGVYFLVSGGAPSTAPPTRGAPAAPAVPPAADPPARQTGYDILLACAALSGLLAGALEGDLFKRMSFLLQTNPGALMTFISFWAILAIFLSSVTVRRAAWIRLPMIQVAFVSAFIYYALIAQPATVDALIDWIRQVVLPITVPGSLPFEFSSALTFPTNLTQLLVLTGCVVFPPFFLLSLLLPYVCNRAQADGRHLGLIYGVNTLAFCAGLILFTLIAPAVNIFFATQFFLVLFLLVTVQVCVLGEHRRFVRWQPAVLSLAVIAAWVLVPDDFNRAYFYPDSPSAKSQITAVMADANTTTHVAEQNERSKILFFGRLFMTGTYPIQQTYMRLMAHFPLLSQPAPTRALLIAFGVGNTASAIATHQSIEHIDIVDLNRNVFATAPRFSYWNNNIVDDPRVRLIHDDGRHFLRVTDGKYDLITSEPPPPMAAGVYRLYSREYYAAALEHLTPSGMMSQWLPTYQMPAEAINLAIRTFIDVFPESALFTGWNNNFILVGGRQPLDLAMVERRLASDAGVAADLRRVGVGDSVSLIGRLISSGMELHEKYPSNKVISDQHNDLEQLFVNPVDRPGLDYDPRRVLADFDIDNLDIGPELRDVLMHFGRLRYRVPGFPLESLARAPEDIRAEIPTADVDWMQIRLLDDRLSLARVTNQREEAADMMQRMLAINREQPELLISLATLELGRGNTAIAIPLLRDFVRIQPETAEGYYLLGTALRNTDSEGALMAWRRANELRPQWLRPLNDMAWLLATHPDAAVRRPAEAVRLAERAIQLSPGNPFLLDTLAAAYAATGDFSRAQQTVEEALRNLDQMTVDIQEADLRSRLALYAARQPMIDPIR